MAVNSDTSMTIRTNSKIKKQAQEVYSKLGIDMSTAINVFLRQSIRHKGFPFEVTLQEPNKTTRRAIKAAVRDEDMYGPFESISDLMESLNA